MKKIIKQHRKLSPGSKIRKKNVLASCLFSGLLFLAVFASAQETYEFEKLGEPLQASKAAISMITTGKRPMAWTAIESPDLYDVVGIDIKNGKTTKLNLEKYGRTHIRIHRSAKGDIYIFYGRPAHFLKYDAKADKLIDLGQAAQDGSYTLRQGIGPDGKMWVGSYPDAELSWVDPATDKIGSFGRIAEDPKERYIMQVLVSDANTVYCAVGAHHTELWAVDAITGKKKQILPENLTRRQGFVSLHLGVDGHVYGSDNGINWRCRPDGIDIVDQLPAGRRNPDVNTLNGERFQSLNIKGELLVQSTSKRTERSIRTDFIMPSKQIYSLGQVIDGKLYGGGASGRATLFTYDIKTGKIKDLGVQGAGTVQIYDILGHSRGVFFTTYTLGGIDIYEPASEKVIPVTQLGSQEHLQERLMQLCLGKDNMIYTGTIPVKGIVGGAMVRINPDDLSVKVWRNIIKDQSLISVVSVPSTGEIFFTSSVRGGSSSIPTQKEAVIGLWDIKTEKVVWQGKPVPGLSGYGQASIGKDGMIYGIADKKYYVFDPKSRKIIKVEELPVSVLRHYAFYDAGAGPKGMIYGLGDDALFAIDPVTREANVLARHESIKRAQGILVTDDGSVYYGSGAGLWRAKPVK